MLLIKIGGGKLINWEYISEDIATLVSQGEKIVIVHGASSRRDEIAKKLGVPTKTIISPSGVSSVYTDEAAMDVFLMVYCGLINKRLVGTLQKSGVNAIGLSGVDGRLWEAKRKTVVYAQENEKTILIRDNLTGKVEGVNAKLLQLLLDHNYIPVLCPPAISEDNHIVNTDNDLAAAVIGNALEIKKMISLFEAPGLLENVKDENSVIKTINKEKLDEMMQFAQGRMKKKLMGAKRAFEQGMEKIYWGDGRVKNPVLSALEGKGTIIS